ncbi:MFS polyamine transporter [Peniophora sp. CONT]|nr:MFS polyamine transporter [Peniophora sp. CONT]
MSARSELPVPNEKSRPESIATIAADAPTPLKPKGSNDNDSLPATTTGGDPAGSTRKGDMLILDWDGPDDPGNPRNWTAFKKWRAMLIVSSFTFISPVSSSMIAPAMGQLQEAFGITSTVILAMTTSVFVLAYAFGPLFLGPLSELYGRSRVLQISNMWYLAWNLGCGFAQSKDQLIAFRFLAGLGGSAPLSIGGGVIGDLFTPEHRGQAIAIYSLAPLIGPVVGPIAGAWIAEKSTWRWVFWATTIVDAAIQVLGLFYLRETYAPVLLEQRAERLRKGSDVEKNVVIRTVYEDKIDRDWKVVMRKSLIRPFVLFYYEPIIQLLGVYMAFVYGLMYLVLTTIPGIFEGVYQEDVGIAGLNYLALGVGLTGASQINARLLDYLYRKLKERNGGAGKPEYRLPSMFPGTLILPAGLFITGWTARADVHWIAPDIGIALIGAGVILNFQAIQTYVIDAFTLHAASALAAVAFLRSLCGFGFPLFAPAMYSALGYGKGDTILGVVAIVIGCPAPYLFWHYGERIRKGSRFAHKS